MDSLVDYSSSGSEEENSNKEKLPLTLCPAASEEQDPCEHDGRVRSIKHERGIWATWIHIPMEDTEDLIQKVQESFMHTLHSFKTITESHISLSRLLILRHHWINQFTAEILRKLDDQKKFRIYSLVDVEFYCNDERTRTFVGLRIEHPSLYQLVEKIDTVLEEYNLPKFYETPSFHCSILWCLGDRAMELQSKKRDLQIILERILEDEDFDLRVTELHCKCGNRIYKFPLR